MRREAQHARIIKLRIIKPHTSRAAVIRIQQMIVAIHQHNDIKLIRDADHGLETLLPDIDGGNRAVMPTPGIYHAADRRRPLITPMRIGGTVV